MKWRWLIYDHIPPELDISRSRRREIRGQFKKQAGEFNLRQVWKTWLLGCIVFFAGMSAYFFILNYLVSIGWRWLRWPPVRNAILFGVVPMCFLHLLAAAMWKSHREKITFDVLRQFGYRICSECGYRLDHQRDEQDRCPECGTLPAPMPPPIDSNARS